MAKDTRMGFPSGGGPSSGGGGARAGKGSPKIKVSDSVSIRPRKKMTDAEVKRLQSTNAPKSDPNAKGNARALKAANKVVAKKPLPTMSSLFGRTVTGKPKQVSPKKAAKYKATDAKTAAKKDAKRTKEMDEYDKFILEMKKYQAAKSKKK